MKDLIENMDLTESVVRQIPRTFAKVSINK